MSEQQHAQELTARQKQALISLPYRVGVWVSHADDEEGEYDDEMEMRALQRILVAYAHEKALPPFVDSLVKDTLSHKDSWQDWADMAMTVVPQSKKAVGFLYARYGETEGRAYAQMLMDVGEAVAMAYGEFGMGDETDSETVLGRFIMKFTAKLRGEGGADDGPGLANISAAEQAALDKLDAALAIDEDEAA